MKGQKKICKNDPNKTYKGTEPSPSGLGYCASGEKEESEMTGKNGKIWVCRINKNGNKTWIKDPYEGATPEVRKMLVNAHKESKGNMNKSEINNIFDDIASFFPWK